MHLRKEPLAAAEIMAAEIILAKRSAIEPDFRFGSDSDLIALKCYLCFALGSGL
jgi:hypothetical protein